MSERERSTTTSSKASKPISQPPVRRPTTPRPSSSPSTPPPPAVRQSVEKDSQRVRVLPSNPTPNDIRRCDE